MIITISGEAGSGKSTCAKKIANKLNLKHYSSGDLMRKMAEAKNMSLAEFSKHAEDNHNIDKELDDFQKKLGRNEDNFIIDGRLSAYFIPHAIKIFLNASLDESASRIHHAKRLEESSESIEAAKKQIIERRNSEIKRYKALYNFNPYESSSYDIVYDTTKVTPDQAVEDIIKLIKK